MRISELRKTMANKGIDAALIVDEKNVRYFSGFTGDSSELLITKDEALFFTDFRYTEQAQMQTSFRVIQTKGIDRDDRIFEQFKRLQAERIGIDLSNVKYPSYKSYLGFVDEKSIIDLSSDIAGQRLVKNSDELAAIRKGAQYNDRLFSHLCGIIKPGISEYDIKAEIIYYMLKSGAESAFDPIVASGENSSLCHAAPSSRKFIPGDFITMDYGFKFDGYCSDFTRTIALDKVDKEQQKVYDIVNQAGIKAFGAIKPGIKCAEVDKTARDYIDECGYGKYFGHGLGHGVGMDVHEAPRLGTDVDDVLKAGMVITNEPGIYIAGRFGVRIEDLCVVTQSGYENLTNAPRDLIII
jgi:Xaa-Pro aminopeptidase